MNLIWAQTKMEVNRHLKPVKGVVSIYFVDLNTGAEFKLNENEFYNTASLMKVVVGLQLVRLFETGILRESTTIKLKNSFASKKDNSQFELSEKVDGEKSLYSKIGLQVSVLELLELMITKSSNLATNNLFELIEKHSQIADLTADLGMSNTKILRGVEDQKAHDAGIINYTTATDMLSIFQYIRKCAMEGNKYVELLYDILKQQKHNSIIPALLPQNLTIAHKTGTLKSTIHNAAHITSPSGKDYILILLSKNIDNKEQITSVFARISQILFNAATEKTTYN